MRLNDEVGRGESPGEEPLTQRFDSGRGAFGVPWFSRAIKCHRLTFDESPLFEDFYLGKGRAAVLIALWTGLAPPKESAAERAEQLGQWTRAIERRSPELRIALLPDSETTIDPERRAVCPRCRVARNEDLDADVLKLFWPPYGDLSVHGEHIYLADGMGRMVFEAPLSETDQIPRLLDKLGQAE